MNDKNVHTIFLEPFANTNVCLSWKIIRYFLIASYAIAVPKFGQESTKNRFDSTMNL